MADSSDRELTEILRWLDESRRTGAEEIKQMLQENKGTGEIVFRSPRDLEKHRSEVEELLQGLRERFGIDIEPRFVGRRVKLTYKLPESSELFSNIREDRISIKPTSHQPKKKARFAVYNLYIHDEILKNKDKPIMKVFSPEEFYNHFEKHFLIPLSDLVDDIDTYLKYVKIILTQAYDKRSVEDLEYLYEQSLKEIRERLQKNEQQRTYESFLKELVSTDNRMKRFVELLDATLRPIVLNHPITEDELLLFARILKEIPKIPDRNLLPYVLRIKRLFEKHKEDDKIFSKVLKDLVMSDGSKEEA